MRTTANPMQTAMRWIVGGVLLLAFTPEAWAQADRYQSGYDRAAVERLEDARSLRQAGASADAVEQLETLVREHPTYYRAWYNLALARAERHQYGAAEGAFRKAQQVKAAEGISDATLDNSLGWLYILMGRYQDAELMLMRAWQSNETAPSGFREKVLNNLGTLYIRLGNPAKAREYLEQAATQYGSQVARDNLALVEQLERQQRERQQRREQ